MSLKCSRNLLSESIASAMQKGFSPDVCWENRCVRFLSAIKGFGSLSAENRLNIDKLFANLSEVYLNEDNTQIPSQSRDGSFDLNDKAFHSPPEHEVPYGYYRLGCVHPRS